MEHADTRCILCGSPERKLLIRQGEWTVHRCGACGLGFLDPRPDALELGDLYRGGYFDDQYGHGLKCGSPEMKKRLSQESHRIRFFRRVKPSGKVLDIGCGMGYFLLACRDAGYDVEGMDLSADSAGYVRSEMKIPVAVGTIDGIDFPPESFDVVTMWHFLEHTPDPRLYLQKARRWLKRDGTLVVDVPNYAGTDARKTWALWKGWQLPFHLYHYTPETLKKLLAIHGFGVVRSKSYLSEHVKEKLERTRVLKPFARLIARCYSGHSFAVVAKKAENREQASP
jgi:2-polyprenyl-3-methyl-5-hydroxy-6-metoxy-1,4-benzoquinol methylase